MICAASAASAGSASSAGWWLTPSLQGTNTIALGTRSATHIVSWAAPECIVMYGSPVAFAASSSAATIRLSSGVAGSVWRCANSASMPRSPRRLLGEGRDVASDPAIRVVVRAPDVEREADAARDRVDDSRVDLDLADRAHRSLPGLAREPLELDDRLGQRQRRVEAEVHRRRAGVVAATVDDDVRVHVAGDGGDDADAVAGVLEHAGLLDVHLDPAG